MNQNAKRYGILAIGTICLLFLGLIYAWSVFAKPLQADFGWTKSETANVFTLSIITFCLGGLTGGILIRKISASWILRISSVCLAAGFLLSAHITALWQIYLTYGILCGFGVGLTYNAVLSTVVRWFGDKAALCSGVLLMGFGSGGFLLSTSANALISANGWSIAFTAIGIAGFAVLIISSFFIVPPKESASGSKANAAQSVGLDLSPAQTLRSKTFWLLFLWGAAASSCGLFVIGQGSPLAQFAASSSTVDIAALASIGALATGTISVFNGLGRVIIGIVYPKIKRRTSMLIICGGYLLALGTVLFAVHTHTIAFIFVGFAVIGLCYGSTPAFGVSIVREFFGTKYYSVNMSLFNLHLIVSALLGSTLIGWVVSTVSSVAENALPEVVAAANLRGYIVGLGAGLLLSTLGLLLSPFASVKPKAKA